MSTAVAAKKSAKSEDSKSEQKKPLRNLEVRHWAVGPDRSTDRSIANITCSFGEIKDFIHAETFDYAKKAGWQREVSEAHIKNLMEEIERNRFTPTSWAFSVREWHSEKMKRSKSPTGQELVDITLGSDPDHSLAITDGNHRRVTLMEMLKEAEETDQKELVEQILNLPVAAIIHLDHKHMSADFLNLQKGRPVARNVTKSMEVLSGLAENDEDFPLRNFATQVIIDLNNNTYSHLAGVVAFGEATLSQVQYASLVSPGASTLGTTVAGGAKIAMEFGKSKEWLMQKYVDVWEAIQKYTKAVDPALGDASIREVLSPGMMLVPIGSRGSKGTRGGSHLIIGIANCFAYIMAHRADDVPTEQDMKLLGEAVDHVFNVDPDDKDFSFSGSAGDKRVWMGKFANRYFKHAKFNNKPDGSSVEYFGKIPAGYIDLMSTSTLDIDKKVWKIWKAEKSGVTPKKRGRKPKDQTPVATTGE